MEYLYENSQSFGLIADLIGIAGAFFALFAWLWSIWSMVRASKEKKRLRQRIPVVLKTRESLRSLELPVHFRRDELNRQELMGRIGMIPMKKKGKRFEIRYTNQPDFLEAINRIKESSVLEPLVIPCSDEEIEQFDVSIK
ncbi:LapA family protein [Prosthecochloris sp. N3]|uniref:LapA family protein n=1 Tax=Prosthecochloris ethylica TaxID=2743976 RepID=A0ABR9XQE2_9CHLB|nr:LapA family protein [Prosthecochloris ethylica]MBF0585470.1 LapA family protein [Prosthecochloris ethylica]MBF0636256.1 LapA family protein [Prosthecochloris ethylica]NUK46700.1 LapA family protein [Prosthecochloris ethylica]